MTEKTKQEPHGRRTCGAKTRAGHPCGRSAMRNGRCDLHGGKSTGPRTPEGLERSRKANWKHGRYSAEAKEVKAIMARLLRESRGLLSTI